MQIMTMCICPVGDEELDIKKTKDKKGNYTDVRN